MGKKGLKSRFGLVQLDEYRWEVPREGGMRVPGRLYVDERMLEEAVDENVVLQVKNVAHLPGIVAYSMAMPDVHWGYGFPIGGVAATDPDQEGVISPGGVGFDINCGVRLLRTPLTWADVEPRLARLVDALFEHVPSGVGRGGFLKVNLRKTPGPLVEGARWMVAQGYGEPEDVQFIESQGRIPGADPDKVSDRAMQRGRDQLGTLGSGNHFLEVDVVESIHAPEVAEAFGLREGQVVVLIHCGSRGFGHQVCSDYLKVMERAMRKYGISLPDRQLACAPIRSKEGQDYLAAMACAANYAFANRQLITHQVRQAFREVFGPGLEIGIVYDVAHNIAKMETHQVDGRPRRLCVHRKGATRAFPAGHPEIPEAYREVGQPVLVPGDMGTGSWVLVGTPEAMAETFGTSCHGAGRVKSRRQAKREGRGRDLVRELWEERGVRVRAEGWSTVAEEMPSAYKDVDAVVRVLHHAGLARRVARLRPVGVVKG